jgi:hypothetical protein
LKTEEGERKNSILDFDLDDLQKIEQKKSIDNKNDD